MSRYSKPLERMKALQDQVLQGDGPG